MNDSTEQDVVGDSVIALRMMPEVRTVVDQAERTLIEAIMDRGWTWEQLGAEYGERSKQAMQQHYRRRGGERTWPAVRRLRQAGTDPADVQAVRAAVARVMSNIRATDEALTHMTGAPWNHRDPEAEARRRLSWVESLNDSLYELNDFINNKGSHDLPVVDRPFVIGERTRILADHAEIDSAKVDLVRAEIERLIARLLEHRDTIDQTVEELRRRDAELAP